MAELTATTDNVPLQLAVIIPAYNVEDTLGEQLDALTEQTWSHPWGILVVDNNSTDSTKSIAQAYADRGVRVVEAYEGRGVAYARNTGVRYSQAATVAFCDGDDVVLPGWVGAIGTALTEASIVSGALETDSLNPPWLARSRPMAKQDRLPTFGTIGFASGCNSGMTRAVFDQLNGFDETFAGLEDIEFSLRARAAGFDIKHVPGGIVAYRFRDRIAAVWRQGILYGSGRPELKRRARQLDLPIPNRLETLKSWAWLILHVPDLITLSGRYRWLWVLANRVGVLRGWALGLRSRVTAGSSH